MVAYACCRTQGGDILFSINDRAVDPHGAPALLLLVMSEKRSARYPSVCKIKQRATESISPESKEELLWDCKMEMLFFP